MDRKPVKVLLIEDSPVDAAYIQRLLTGTTAPWIGGASFEVTHVDRVSAGLGRLADSRFELVLLDLMLPDAGGLESLARVRSAAQRVPIVVLTSNDDEQFAIKALQQGAQDYLVKGGVTRQSLARAVRYAIERGRVEEELTKALEWQGAIFEGSRDAIFISDADSCFVFVNHAASQLTGYSKEELLGMRIPDLHEDVDLVAYRQYHDRIMAGEEMLSEAKVLRKDRVKLDVEFSNRRITVSGVAYMHTAGRDVSARKRVEEALRESEERYRKLFENAPIGIYRTAPDGRILMANPALARMLGYDSFEELAARNLEKEGFEPTYSRDLFKETIEREGEMRGVEAAWIRHDGSILWVRENATAVTGPGGEVVYYEGTVEDITKRKRAEEALRDSEERFRLLIENSSDIVTIMNTDGAVRYVSPSLERLTGYDPKDRLGRTPFDFIHPDDQERSRSVLRKLIENPNSIQSAEYRYRHRDGSWRILESIIKTIHDDSGAPRLAAYSRDITEQKKAEEDLREFAAKLERSNRDLQEFAYIASHDLQEPLRKVMAFGDRLKARFGAALETEGLDYLGRMRNAASRMQTLINDLLALSRVTTKARPFVTVALNQLASEVLSDLEIRIEQVAGRVEVGELPTIDADPMQVHQLLQNLISNALKFHRPGIPPVVKITGQMLNGTHAGVNAQPEEVCQIVVEDNGIGFDEKHSERVFTVFQRLHSRGEYEGTGIGLAICRKIAERHRGSVVAKSVPGEGSSFIVELPARQPRGEAGQ
jgi:PAS domain S-box-containing protein